MTRESPLMTAVVFDGKKLFVTKTPLPVPGNNEVLVKVLKAGICNTDLEITRGYVPDFNGIPGHEFVGIIAEACDTSIIGKRCTAEINYGCGTCDYCRNGMERHCPKRTVLGIINRNGAFAEYIAVPVKNITFIPDAIPDNRAVFIEPLAAALEILDQISITAKHTVLLWGEGKLGLLIGQVLSTTGCSLTIAGKHADKMAFIENNKVKKVLAENFQDGKYDIVIEATGNPSVFNRALLNVKPRGTLVLKSTYANDITFNPSSVVVDEITILGSRCGRFAEAIAFMSKNDIPFERLISREFHISSALEAFEYSAKPGILKVVLDVART